MAPPGKKSARPISWRRVASPRPAEWPGTAGTARARRVCGGAPAGCLTGDPYRPGQGDANLILLAHCRDRGWVGGQIVEHACPGGRAFVDATRPVYDSWRERIGADLVEQAEESVANR